MVLCVHARRAHAHSPPPRGPGPRRRRDLSALTPRGRFRRAIRRPVCSPACRFEERSSMRKSLSSVLSVVLPSVLSLAAAGCVSHAGASGASSLKVAYFQGSVAGPDAVVAANPELAAGVKSKIELRPIDSGVAGMAQLRAG